VDNFHKLEEAVMGAVLNNVMHDLRGGGTFILDGQKIFEPATCLMLASFGEGGAVDNGPSLEQNAADAIDCALIIYVPGVAAIIDASNKTGCLVLEVKSGRLLCGLALNGGGQKEIMRVFTAVARTLSCLRHDLSLSMSLGLLSGDESNLWDEQVSDAVFLLFAEESLPEIRAWAEWGKGQESPPFFE